MLDAVISLYIISALLFLLLLKGSEAELGRRSHTTDGHQFLRVGLFALLAVGLVHGFILILLADLTIHPFLRR